MIRTCLLAATLLAAVPAHYASAQTYKFKTIKDGQNNMTSMHDINDAGTAVGGVFAALGDVRNCIIVNGKDITTLSDPNGVNGTECWGISSNGTIVGDYVDKKGNFNGYSYSNGTFTDIAPPKSVYTIVYGVNASGVSIGYYLDKSGNSFGFLFDGTNYTVITIKGGSSTEGFGINDAGEYTVTSVLSDGFTHSYLYKLGKTKGTEIIFPDFQQVAAHHLSSKGLVSATIIDANGGYHAGVFDPKMQAYYTIDAPKGAGVTIGDGIDKKQTLVGRYQTSNNISYGYIAKGKL